MKFRERCCCAIPTANAGIFATLTEQFVLGILVGALSVATPSIVGAATPSFAPWVLAIISFLAAGIQVLGFIGAGKGKSILFRRYISLHSIAAVAAFAVAVVWIIISASRHSTAKSACIKNFFDISQPDQQTEADTMCEIFPWVDVGIMGGLWVVLAAVHIYFYVVILSFSTYLQQGGKYDSLNNESAIPLKSESIPMNSRDPWDSRPSPDVDRSYDHYRQNSAASAADVLSQPMHKPQDGFQQQSYPPYSQPYRQGSADTLAHPVHAYTQDPGPTPQFSDSFYTGRSGDYEPAKPSHIQNHPAEGSFGRKPPRLVKQDVGGPGGYY